MVPAAGFAAVAGIGGEFAKQNPMLFGMVFSGTKTTVANLFSQLVLEQKEADTFKRFVLQACQRKLQSFRVANAEKEQDKKVSNT